MLSTIFLRAVFISVTSDSERLGAPLDKMVNRATAKTWANLNKLIPYFSVRRRATWVAERELHICFISVY